MPDLQCKIYSKQIRSYWKSHINYKIKNEYAKDI